MQLCCCEEPSLQMLGIGEAGRGGSCAYGDRANAQTCEWIGCKDVAYLMSSRMAFSDCSTSSALAGCSGPLYPPSRSRIHPDAGRPTASAATPANNGGLDVTCMQWLNLVIHPQCPSNRNEQDCIFRCLSICLRPEIDLECLQRPYTDSATSGALSDRQEMVWDCLLCRTAMAVQLSDSGLLRR